MNTTTRVRAVRTTLAAGVLALGGCDTKSPPAPASTGTAPSLPGASVRSAQGVVEAIERQQHAALGAASAAEGSISVGGLRFVPPAGWKSVPAGGMRSAEFSFTNAAPGTGSVVFFTGIGGSPESNIERWRGQVQPDAGGEAVVSSFAIAGAYRAMRIQQVGTYAGMGPGGASGRPTPRTMFIGVVIEGPRGPIHVRLTGNLETCDLERPKFDALIDGAQAE